MNSNLVSLIPQFFDSSGNPLQGGTLNSYIAGTTTSLSTYPTHADAVAGTNPNPNAISINASGYPAVSLAIVGVFLKPGKQYKFVLKDSAGATIYTLDNISNLTDSILDANGNEVMKFVAVASAVNEITATNAATGNDPSFASTGDDTNIGIIVKGQGTGKVRLGQATSTGVQLEADQPILDSSGNELIKFVKTASAVNEITVTNAATTTGPSITVTGGDTNADLNVGAKGTGDIISQSSIRLSAAKTLIFEGTTDDAFETTVTAGEPTTDNTITLPNCSQSQHIVQHKFSMLQGASAADTTHIPIDTSTPQITEGTEFLSLAITPKSATNNLIIRVNASIAVTAAAADYITVALFAAGGANAVACGMGQVTADEFFTNISFTFQISAGSIDARTYTVRFGGATQTTQVGSNTTVNQGGKITSSIEILEVTQ